MAARTPWIWAASASVLAFADVSKNVYERKSSTPKSSVESKKFDDKIEKAKQLIEKTMITKGIPGLSIGVSIDGKIIWKSGFGYANVESDARCTEKSVMRIASISKPITATIAALLIQEGKLDIDKSIYEYLPEFPKKTFNGKPVDITLRQLFSHTSGVRHYEKKKLDIDKDLENPADRDPKTGEYLSNVQYNTVQEALEMFKNDDLIGEPGKQFSYTTHGLTLASAVLEKASGREFPRLVANLSNKLELTSLALDKNQPIITGRVSYYHRPKGTLENCQEVNNSYKWAGGGLLCNVGDLLKFAHVILGSYQNLKNSVIEKRVIDELWKREVTVSDTTEAGLGWMKIDGLNNASSPTIWYHTGAAIGASSVLLIRPTLSNAAQDYVSGICVVILCNLQDVSLLQLSREIELVFRE